MEFKIENNHSKDSHKGHLDNHTTVITSLNKAFIVGIVLNLSYVIIQIIIGLQIKKKLKKVYYSAKQKR